MCLDCDKTLMDMRSCTLWFLVVALLALCTLCLAREEEDSFFFEGEEQEADDKVAVDEELFGEEEEEGEDEELEEFGLLHSRKEKISRKLHARWDVVSHQWLLIVFPFSTCSCLVLVKVCKGLVCASF